MIYFKMAVAALGLMFSVFSVAGCSRKPLTAADIDQQVNAAFPAHAERERVITVLDSMGIDHTGFDDSTRTIGAKMEDHRSKGLVTHAFQITFIFDSAGKLLSHKVKEVFTGP